MILHAVEAGHGEPLVLLHGLFGSARNFATVQREFARQHRSMALDLRNHGASPHDADMRYEVMAADVLQTLDRMSALPATLVGHSMGGKVAMRVALAQPDAVTRLIVADIAPVAYPPHYHDIAEAMAALELSPGMKRAVADAALAAAVPDPAMRPFLLQNLQLGASPGWRMGLHEIATALPEIEIMGRAGRCALHWPDAVHRRRHVGLHQAGASPGYPHAVPPGTLRDAEECRSLAACR